MSESDPSTPPPFPQELRERLPELDPVALAVVHRQRVHGVALALEPGGHGGRVQPAGQQHDCPLSRILSLLHLPVRA